MYHKILYYRPLFTFKKALVFPLTVWTNTTFATELL